MSSVARFRPFFVPKRALCCTSLSTEKRRLPSSGGHGLASRFARSLSEAHEVKRSMRLSRLLVQPSAGALKGPELLQASCADAATQARRHLAQPRPWAKLQEGRCTLLPREMVGPRQPRWKFARRACRARPARPVPAHHRRRYDLPAGGRRRDRHVAQDIPVRRRRLGEPLRVRGELRLAQ